MEVVTDGEMRRLSFQSGLPDAVDGFGEVPLEAYLWATGTATRSATGQPTARPALGCASRCGGAGTSQPRTSRTSAAVRPRSRR